MPVHIMQTYLHVHTQVVTAFQDFLNLLTFQLHILRIQRNWVLSTPILIGLYNIPKTTIITPFGLPISFITNGIILKISQCFIRKKSNISVMLLLKMAAHPHSQNLETIQNYQFLFDILNLLPPTKHRLESF